MTFDQFSRYNACADILRLISTNGRILDVGSGLELALGNYLKGYNITYVDPLLAKSEFTKDNIIDGNVFDDRLNGQEFDYVCSVDTIEHVPIDFRKDFIDRIANIATKGIVLGFPCKDDDIAYKTDIEINTAYQKVYDKPYPWLEEHFNFGLPLRVAIVKQLQDAGWKTTTIGHGHAPWLSKLLSLVVIGWELPEAHSEILRLSKDFVEQLYLYDFTPPYYRWFIIATKDEQVLPHLKGLLPIDDYAAQLFNDLHRDAIYSIISSIINSNDSFALDYINSNEKLNEIASWAKILQTKLNEAEKATALNNNILRAFNSETKKTTSLSNDILKIFNATRKIEEKIECVEDTDFDFESQELELQSLTALYLMDKIFNIGKKAKGYQLKHEEALQAIDTIYNSKAWKTITILRKIRMLILPRNSSRQKLTQTICLHSKGVMLVLKILSENLNALRLYIIENGLKKTLWKFFFTIRYRRAQIFNVKSLKCVPLKRNRIDRGQVDSYIGNQSITHGLQSILDKLMIPYQAHDLLLAISKSVEIGRFYAFIQNVLQIDDFLINTFGNRKFNLIKTSQLPEGQSYKPSKNILFVTAQAPSPYHGGGNRVLNFIKILSEKNNIYLCTSFVEKEDDAAILAIEPFCKDILKIPHYKFGSNQELIKKWINKKKIDIVHYEWPLSLNNYDKSFGKHQIFTYMEAVSLRLLMELNSIDQGSTKWIDAFLSICEMLRIEIVDASLLNMRIAVTTKDADFFRGFFPYQEYAIVNHGLCFDEFLLPEIESDPCTLLFIGNYEHPPNDEAMSYFFNCIWENVYNEIPEVRILLVGANPTQRIKRLSDGKRIIATGKVPDVRPYIQKATLCIAPLISGAGLRGKVIEYAALRRTFVATSLATEDLAFKDGVDYLCADNSQEFSNNIIKLLKNKSLRVSMANNVFNTAKDNYDTRYFVNHLSKLYNFLEDTGRAKV